MPTRTDKSKLLHYLESHIEPATDRPSDAVHIIDGNTILQCLTAIPDTFEELAESVFNQLPKAKRVDFITDTYIQHSVKSYECARRVTAPTYLLSGARAKNPHDRKSFMSNDKNKTQLIDLLLAQRKTDKYSFRLIGRNIYYVVGEKVFRLTCEKGKRKVQGLPQSQAAALSVRQEEEDTDKTKQAQIEQTYEKH